MMMILMSVILAIVAYKNLFNNAMFITLTADNWEIESILYIYKYEENSNL